MKKLKWKENFFLQFRKIHRDSKYFAKSVLDFKIFFGDLYKISSNISLEVEYRFTFY